MFIISVCGTGLFDEVTATVCADMGVLGTVTNLTSLGGVFNWVYLVLVVQMFHCNSIIPHPATKAAFCPVTPTCTSLGATFVLLYPV